MIRAARRSILLVFSVVGVVTVMLFLGWWQVDGPGRPETPMSPSSSGLPIPLYKMDFQLTDHFAQTVGPESWIGSPTLVFFGFTYCPDVCPMTLANISGWLEELGDEASSLRVVFISVDPDRDTVQAMADYVSNFHPAITGYRGTAKQTARAAEAFNVRYERVSSESGYTVNHSASVFIFDTKGDFVSTIDYHESGEFAVPKIRRGLQLQ